MTLDKEKIQAITSSISHDISYRNHLYQRDMKQNKYVYFEVLDEYVDTRIKELDAKIWKNLERIVGDPEIFAKTGAALPKSVVDELIRAWMYYAAMFSPDTPDSGTVEK